MNKKKYSPAAVGGMAVAAIAGVAFAVWNISRSLNPPVEPQDPPLTTTAPAEATSANSGAETAANTGAAETQTAANPAPGQRRQPGPEAMMAPAADPFAPLAVTSIPQQPLPVVTQQPQQAPIVPERMLPTYGAGIQASPLSPQALAALQSRGTVKPAPVELPTPELIGTLLGARPSAVFRSKDGVVVVAAGEKFGGWKVSRVVHGGVVLIHGKRKVTVGTSMAGAMHAEQEESRPAPARAQMAEIKAEPAPAVEPTPDPFLVAEAVNVNKTNPIPAVEPAAATPAPAPAPVEEAPAPAPPVVQETAPPPKPEGVKEEPAKKEPTR